MNKTFFQEVREQPHCPRCQGLMMKIFVDCVDSSEFATPGLPVYFQRCLNCGERLDEQILVNRQERGTTKVRSGWPAKKVSLL